MRCARGASRREVEPCAVCILDRHRALCSFGCIAAQAQIVGLRPGDHDPKHHHRHREGATGEPAGAAAAADSTDVQTSEPVHRPAEVQAAGPAALAHPHLRRSGGRAVRRRLPRRPELRRRQRQRFSRRDSARDRCSRAVRTKKIPQPFESSRHAWRRSTSPTRRPSRRRTIPDTSATTAGASRPAIDATRRATSRSLGRAERDGRAREDQWGRPHRRAPATGPSGTAGRHRGAAAWSTANAHATPKRHCMNMQLTTWRDRRPCEHGVRRRRGRRAADLAAALKALENGHGTSTRSQSDTDDSAGDRQPADDARAGVPARSAPGFSCRSRPS